MQTIIRGLVLASLSVTMQTAAAWGTPESLDYGYEGEVNADGQPHGRGVMTWATQWHSRRIEGEFRDGKAHGQGVYTGGQAGDYYKGEWRDGHFHGQGERWLPTGPVYKGEFRKGKFHGQGVMTVPNGQGYEGEFRDGKFHGQGVYTWPDGTRIEGRWFYGGQYIGSVNESGQPHGYGVMSWWGEGAGNLYVGEWRDGRRDGYGVMTFRYKEPNLYEGEWGGEWGDGRRDGYEWDISATFEDVGGLPHGQGIMTWRYSSGISRHEGGFREGRRHGRGVYTGTDGERTEGEWREGERRKSEGVRLVSKRVASVSFGSSEPVPTYEGELQDGKPHGQGVMSWSKDGRRYEGNFRDGHLDFGVLTWPDGRRYEGEFRNWWRHGKGVLTWPDGRRYEGGYFRGYRSGDGVMTWPDGRRIEGEWIEDRFQGE